MINSSDSGKEPKDSDCKDGEQERHALGQLASPNIIQLYLDPAAKIQMLVALARSTWQGGECPRSSNLFENSWVALPHGTILLRKWGLFLSVRKK